ncbi:DNA-binding transcriptional regulator, LacI/PurR family [Microlunatus flavus]|uniref:DNA-binding transcriptional regulator, LacI/PurR family n=1 Tax=Microlunatus flavus TaxID=1036181 RepID=A0A1H9FWX7_9ACTN|nr:DNA-binding transcriptional regulator, LacI/PurR family [Microlunatus flavus]
MAKLAGVSAKTVSNVVNEYVHVRPATRERVQNAIDMLGYRPNVVARNLKSGRSGVIALALPELDSPYFAELAHHVVQAAMERGWTVLVDETGQIQDSGLRARERSAAGGIRQHLIDGVILNPLALDEGDLTRYGSVPLVLLGERLGSHVADHVAIDNAAAAAEATRHLLETGRRRIAVVGSQPPPFGHTARLRLRGYRDALAEAGIRYDASLVVPAEDWRLPAGRAGVAPLLALPEPPDAVFALNDVLALGVLRGLADAGVRVPEDVAVVGFDDVEQARYSVPALTTVAPDKESVARSAVEQLARRLDAGDAWTPQEITIGHTLVVRESSGG